MTVQHEHIWHLNTDVDPETHCICHNQIILGVCDNITTIKLLITGLSAQSLKHIAYLWVWCDCSRGLWWTLSCLVQLQYWADNSSASCQSWKPTSFWCSQKKMPVTMGTFAVALWTGLPNNPFQETQKTQIMHRPPLVLCMHCMYMCSLVCTHKPEDQRSMSSEVLFSTALSFNLICVTKYGGWRQRSLFSLSVTWVPGITLRVLTN